MSPSMKRAPLRVGLIGCGGIVQKSHLPGLLEIPDLVTVSAIADPIPENRNRVGTAADIPLAQRYEDHRHLLDRAELDAAIIATPASLARRTRPPRGTCRRCHHLGKTHGNIA